MLLHHFIAIVTSLLKSLEIVNRLLNDRFSIIVLSKRSLLKQAVLLVLLLIFVDFRSSGLGDICWLRMEVVRRCVLVSKTALKVSRARTTLQEGTTDGAGSLRLSSSLGRHRDVPLPRRTV